MNKVERKKLLDAYFEHHRKVYRGRDVLEAGRPKQAAYDANAHLEWAVDAFIDATFDNPELSWALILDALERDLTPDELSFLAAGEPETLIRCHGEEFIDRFEEQAAKNDKFREMLAGLWISTEDLDRDLHARLLALGCLDVSPRDSSKD